jgi:alkylation response protein AidB-like acyl-CoA dehydrogenase
MFVHVEVLRSLLIEASVRAGSDDGEARAAVSAAKVQLATGGKYVSQQSIQLHGGIGITDEHDIGLYFKRMEALNRLFGDEDFHVRRYASLPSSVTGMAVR